MRWRDLRESGNVEDRRRLSPRVAVGGGLGTVVLVIVILLLGGDPTALLQNPGSGTPGTGFDSNAQSSATDPADDELARFVRAILGSTEEVWHAQFRKLGKTYREPTLVLFRGQVSSACGMASAAVGPFYCPADEKVYIDLSFYDELSRRFKAPGDFAQAYVIAHEVGHHVQNLLGISDQVHARKGRMSTAEFNALSVRLELQADFLAGVWAHHAQKSRRLLEEGDLEEGLRAAAAIGDDRLQKQSQGYVVPDSFTHGTSAQRVRWFRRGLESGDLGQGDTFAIDQP